MKNKTINIDIDVDEKVAYFIENIALLKHLTLSEAYTQIIDLGIKKGAKNLTDAIHKGLLEHKEEVEIICNYVKLQEITKAPIKPANEVEASLMENAKLAINEEILAKVKERFRKGAKK